MSSLSTLKPIKLYGKGGPNPPKVAMVIAELGIPHEIVPITFPDLKKPDYLALNPNGRMPTIYDPNTDITVWESGAIILYLIERYDPERRMSFEPGSKEATLANQWLFFQVSGQGPYFGQAVWFTRYHSEKLPSAIERYCKEIVRVYGVLEGHLKKEKEAAAGVGDGPWLVGNKFSFADLSFLSWHVITPMAITKEVFDLNTDEQFPEVKAWFDRMLVSEATKKVIEEQVLQGH